MIYDSLPYLGIPVHHRDIAAVLDAIDGFVRAGRRTGRSHQIVTVNTDFLVQARRNEDVHAILRSADLAIPDGMPIVWASAALGQPLPGRIAGADLVPAIAERAARHGHKLMLFGGTEDVAERAAAVLRAIHPDLVVAASSGVVSSSGETAADVLEEIRDFGPDLICVALGHPKQERWIRRYAASLAIPVAVGVGGTFDFIAGETARAATWIQRSGFEWLFRLVRDPRRLTRRYMTDIAVYVPTILMQIARTRFRRRQALPTRRRHPSRVPDEVVVVSSDDEVIVVALRNPGPLDHHTAANLTSLATKARRQGRQLRLVSPGREATRSLELLRLDRIIPLVPPGQGSRGRSSRLGGPERWRPALGAELTRPAPGRAATSPHTVDPSSVPHH